MFQKSILALLCVMYYSIAFSQIQSPSSVNPEAENYSIVKVFLENHDQFHILMDNDFDIDHVHGDPATGIKMHLKASDVLKLDKLGIKHEIVIHDYYADYVKRQEKDLAKMGNISSTREASNFSLGSVGGFYSYDEVVTKLDEMTSLFPNLATAKFSIGTSIEGRDIWALKISDNPNVDEAEPVTYYDALHHAREPLSMAVTINYMFWLLENYSSNPEVQYLVDNRELYFVPVVNPDGYEYNKQTNPNGGGLWRKKEEVATA